MRRFTGILFLAGAFMLAGTSVIAARFVSGRLGTFTISAASLFFAVLGLAPLCWRRLRATLKYMTAHSWLMLLLQAIFGIFLFRLFLLKGLIYTSAGEAGILTGTTPAVTSLLAFFLLKEPIYKVRILSIISTVMGILMIQGLSFSDNSFISEHFVGNVLVLCAAICESLFNILSRIASIKTSLFYLKFTDPIVQTILVAGIALLLCLWPAYTEHSVSSMMKLDFIGWIALAWYGLMVTALAFILWYAGIKRCEASIAASFSGMMPFTSLILSVLLLGEQFGWQQWLGGMMVAFGMVIIGIKGKSVFAG